MAGKTRRGRPLSQQPALAYDYRRAILIIQVLAMDKSEGLQLTDFQTLAKNWGVNPNGTYQELLTRLAQHALEKARKERE